MRLFGLVDNEIDRFDRPMFFGDIFDGAFSTEIVGLYDDIGTAIMELFNADADLSAAVNALYLNKVPQITELPYAVFYVIDTTKFRLLQDDIETADVQFNLFADSASDVADILNKLLTVYDWSVLNMTSNSFISMRRVSVANVGFVDDVWQLAIFYEASFLN